MNNWIKRQGYLLDFTLSSLQRRKSKNIGLMAIYALVVFMLASALLFSHALRREANILLQGSPEILVQKMLMGRHDLLPQSHIEKLKGLRGTNNIRGRLWGYLYDPVASANYTFMVPENPPAEGEVKIGEGIARVRAAGVGDRLSFTNYSGELKFFKITEIFRKDSALLTSDLFLLNEKDFREFFGLPPGLYTDAVIGVKNPREVGKVAEKISALLPDSRIILRDEILRTYAAIFDWREGLLLVLLSGGLLAFGIFAWEKASGLSAEEKREIGILKAIGWEAGDIISMKSWEGLVISLTAFLLGYILAYFHVFYSGAPLFAQVLKGWAMLYPDFRPTPFIDEFQVATLALLTIFPYTLATIIPVWRAAVIDPDMVMR